MVALHMSGTVAHSLANTLKPVLRADGTFDLVDVRMHNVVEHDRSLTRLDFRQGDNWTFQPHSKSIYLSVGKYTTREQAIHVIYSQIVLQQLLDDAKGGPMTLKTLAVSYKRRKQEHEKSGGAPLGLSMWFVNMLITVGFINTETTGHPSPQQVTTFYTEERFEDYILENPEPRTLHGLVWKAVVLWWHVTFG